MTKDNDNLLSTWGRIHCGLKEFQYFYKDDIEKWQNIDSRVPIFQCVEVDYDFITLRYGEIYIRVKPEVYRKISQRLEFQIGNWIQVKANHSKKGIIYMNEWHHEFSRPMYFIRVNGIRKSTRRYFEDELEKIDKPPA